MNKSINLGSKGYYSLSVLDKDGNIKEDKSIGTVDNVITYAGAYASLISSNGTSPLFSYLYAAVGTGTVERSRDSIGLGAESGGRSSGASSSRSGNEVDNLDGTSTLTLTRTLAFSLGQLVGTFSEVGLYNASTGGTFIAGQLIKDELGNPTTITLLADEQLIVTYTLEWIVPNTSVNVGTGSVTDANSNVYNYEVWAQPYFSDYTVGGTYYYSRYFSSNAADEQVFRDSLGTGNYGISIDTGTGWSGRVSHDGSGTVTATTQPYTYSPTEFNAVDIVFVGFYASAYTSTNLDIVDTSKALTASSLTSAAPALFIKFLNPITKTSNDSFSIQASLTLTL